MFKKATLATLITTSLFSLPSGATQPVLDEIVVTASRVAESVDESLASVTVITHNDIAQQQAGSLHELLAGHLGLSIVSTGGHGKSNSLSMRGGNESHTLVLIDGVQIGSATNGALPLQHIDLSQIERIEVVRGPLSSLYGSNAISGVIQIFTKKSKNTSSIYIGKGTENSQKAGASFNVGSDKHSLSMGISHFSTDGINARVNSHPDRDGYYNNSLNLRVNNTLSEAVSSQFSLIQSMGNNEYDGWNNDEHYETDHNNQIISFELSINVNEFWQNSFQFSELLDENSNYSDGELNSMFDTRRFSASWQNDLSLTDTTLATAGIDFVKDDVISTSNFSVTERENIALFMQLNSHIGDISTQLSARHDDNEAFGATNTGNLSIGIPLTDDSNMRISYGTAFKAPTFNDLYYPTSLWSSGNPDLQPEESRNVEIGFKQRMTSSSYELNIFRNKVINLIEWACTASPAACSDSNPSNDFWQPSNVASAIIRGAEFALSHRVNDWQMGYQMTLLDAKDKETGLKLSRRAANTTKVDLIHHGDRLTSSINLLLQSYRYNDDRNNVRLAGYGLVNLAFTYQISAPLSAKLEIGNLLDKAYQTANTYNSLGRTGFVTLNYSL